MSFKFTIQERVGRYISFHFFRASTNAYVQMSLAPTKHISSGEYALQTRIALVPKLLTQQIKLTLLSAASVLKL